MSGQYPPQLTKKMKDSFQKFLMLIDNAIEDLEKLMNGTHFKTKLNGSLESLDFVEQFYKAVVEGVVKIEIPMERLEAWIATYIGEVFIKNVGGYWVLGDLPNDHFGTPVIANYLKSNPAVARFPINRVHFFAKNKNAGEFKKMIQMGLEDLKHEQIH